MKRVSSVKALAGPAAAALCLLILLFYGVFGDQGQLTTDFSQSGLAPSFAHPFGTDWMGRDMLTRTLFGMSRSLGVGLLAALISAAVALVLGTIAAVGGKQADRAVSWVIDLFLGIPHILLVLLISFALGGGMKGVVVGVAVTHWPSLARVVRSELLSLRSAPYLLASRQLGKGPLFLAARHMLPHLLPQLVVGTVLLFPHAILHESAITFLGFGLSPHEPAMGILLAESMDYLTSGMWWLAVFPGLSLLAGVLLFEYLGSWLQKRFTSEASI